MSRWVAVLAGVALACAACGKDSPSGPTAPTGGPGVPAAGSSTQGARILGNVSAGEPLAALAAQVVGTSITAPVGAGGGFTLEGVPAGAVQLRFQGSGVDASVALSPVQPGDVVSVLVGVSAATATVQSESRNAGGKVELEGRVESLPPTQQPDTLVVSGRTVKTTPGVTVFRDGINAAKGFSDLAIGQRVHVRGTLATDVINADLVIIQNTNTWIPVNVNGIATDVVKTGVTPPPYTFKFKIGSREIMGDVETKLFGDDDGLLPLSALVDGVRVEVKGEQRDGFVYALRIHINGPTTPEPPQDDSASVEGELVKIDPPLPVPPAPILTPPTLTIRSLAGGAVVETIVTTTFATDVQRRGDVQTLAALALGQTIHAVGTRMADKTLAARKLQIKDDGPDGPFVIEGSLGGLKGTCPALTFGVNGYTVTTSSATTFLPGDTTTCESLALKSGMKVEVEGTRGADGIVLAKTVTKK